MGHSTEQRRLIPGHLVEVSENELRVPASPADVGMLPIPTEPWMHIAVVTGDASKTQSHRSEKHEPQNHEDRNRVT